MRVRIQAQGFDLTPAIAARINERVDRMLSRFAEELISVDVYLKDLNGPRGGHDKQVIIRTQVRHLSPVSVSTTHEDLYKAINVGARRCMRAVRRAIGRKRLVRSRGLQYIVSATGDL